MQLFGGRRHSLRGPWRHFTKRLSGPFPFYLLLPVKLPNEEFAEIFQKDHRNPWKRSGAVGGVSARPTRQRARQSVCVSDEAGTHTFY